MSLSNSPTLTSNLTRQNFLTQKRKGEEKDRETTYFKEVLSEAGVSLKYDDDPNCIIQEQALVVRDITKTLRTHISYPTNSKEFVVGLKKFCTVDDNLKKALLPTNLKEGADIAHVTKQQDSLIRILLNVSCLQDDVIELLLKHVTNCAVEENNETRWLRILLNPLRYLAHITNSKFLITKLVDITEIAVYEAQLEVLNLLPEIIPDSEYEETARQLSKLLDDNPDLTGAIIDCLNSFNLSSHILHEIQEQVLFQLDSPSSSKIFPILFEFVITERNNKDLQNVLLQARNALDAIIGRDDKKDAASNKALICNRLHALITARNNLYDGWVTLISTTLSNADVKPIDMLILFLLHSVAKSRKSSIEILVRKRIQLGLFKISMLEELFTNYFVTQTLTDYLKSIIEIATSLLRFHNESVLIQFSETIFKLLFNHKLLNRIQRQDIIYSLTLFTDVSDKKSVRPIIKVLLLLLSEDFSKLQQHTLQLMGLLEKLDTINLYDVKLLFELLCGLICGEQSDDSMSGLKDEIHMIIRKRLSSSSKNIKHGGIVAAIMMIKTLVSTSQEESVVNDIEDTMCLDDLPTGGPREAAALLDLTNTCTINIPDSVGLLYDELAYMIISSSQMQQMFMAWLYQEFTNNFQNTFVVEAVPPPINDIEVSMQYSLNTADETESQIGINIVERTLKSQFYGRNSILILAPLFRLLRLVYYKQHDGDLTSINALLGCAVIMPDLSDIDIYDSEQLKQVSDCIFHCINWFREVVNAFVTQKKRNLRYKVLQRLCDIVKLEELLEKYLENIPNHKLPLSYFNTVSQVSKQLSPAKTVTRPKKKQKLSDTTVNINETVASTSTTQTKVVKKKKDFKRQFSFREMDTDIMLLLRYPLQIGSDLNISVSESSQIVTLNVHQFQFIMKDVVCKLGTLINGRDVQLSNMTLIKLDDLIIDFVKLLPSIKKQLTTITTALDELLKETDGCVDTEQMFTSYANNLKTSFALIMECYSLVFGWSGFQNPQHLQLLKDCLKSLRDDQQSQLISLKGLVMEFTGKLLENVEHCLSLLAAVYLIEIMQAFYIYNRHAELKKVIAVTSGKLLSKRWYNERGHVEGGKDAYLNINKLVKAYLSNATANTLSGLIGTLQEQVSDLKTKEDSLSMLASIDKCNFHVFYRCLCTALVETIRNEIISLTNAQHLVLWRVTALSMQGLMTVVKVHETKTNLISYLKNCIAILKIFLSNGIPILEIMLGSKTEEVVEIFKLMQTSTRFLHHLCCYSKCTKDVSLVSYVPQFRQTLESLLYRVKAALVANGCSDAFWMGTLKNKNLHGEDILSQSSMATSNDTTDNEELPPDDADEEIEEDDIGIGNESSASDII